MTLAEAAARAIRGAGLSAALRAAVIVGAAASPPLTGAQAQMQVLPDGSAVAGRSLLMGATAMGVAPGAYLAARQADAAGDAVAAARLYLRALERDPDNLALLEASALNLTAAGRIGDAVRVSQRLESREPAHRVAALTLTANDIAAGRFSEARARIAERPDAFHPLTAGLLDGWAARALDEDVAAVFRALDTPTVFQLFSGFHLGLLHAMDGDHAAAVEAFATVRGMASGPTARLALAYGASLEALGRVDEARALYEETASAARLGDPIMAAALARLDAGDPPVLLVATPEQGAAETLFAVAAALGGEGGRRFAIAHAQLAAHLRPDLSGAHLMIAELLEAEEQPDLALDAYGRVPADDALWGRAQIGRAVALEALDRQDAAVEALRAVVARMPDAIEAHLALGDLMRRREDWDASAQSYATALALNDDEGRADWTIHYRRGIAHERAGRWPEAEADFLRALELEPDQPLVLNYLGYSWVEQRMNLDEAKAMIEKAVDLRPEDGYITDSLGWVLYRLGDYEGAVGWLERAVELEPVDPVINDHLGDALWRVGRRLEAEFQWRRARSLDPEPKDLARIRRKLAVGLDVVLEEEAAEAEGDARAGRNGG